MYHLCHIEIQTSVSKFPEVEYVQFRQFHIIFVAATTQTERTGRFDPIILPIDKVKKHFA
jgi:hypothetical protein